MTKININKYLASVGLASRRKIDSLVKAGKVSVNGQLATPGQLINPGEDSIMVNQQKVGNPEKMIYIMLNKPLGVVSTASDEKGRKTVVELVNVSERIYPVGRLDQDSEGLIILTNDGALANHLTHPRYQVPKTYQVVVMGDFTEGKMKQLLQGVRLKEGVTSPAEVKLLKQEGNKTHLQMTIKEGWNREIRRMCGILNLEVISLKRIGLGTLFLGDLKVGEYRSLTEAEVNNLQSTFS